MEQIYKNCRKHGDLTREGVIKTGYRVNLTIRWKCKQCMKELHRANYLKNLPKIKAKHNAYRQADPEKIKKCRNESFKKHRHKYLERENVRKKQWRLDNLPYVKYRESNYSKYQVKGLADGYLKKLLKRGTKLEAKDIPPELVKVKRITLAINRDIKKRKKEVDTNG